MGLQVVMQEQCLVRAMEISDTQMGNAAEQALPVVVGTRSGPFLLSGIGHRQKARIRNTSMRLLVVFVPLELHQSAF